MMSMWPLQGVLVEYLGFVVVVYKSANSSRHVGVNAKARFSLVKFCLIWVSWAVVETAT